MLFMNNGYIYYILFSNFSKIVLLEIYADKKQMKRAFDDKLAYRGISIFTSK